MGRILRAGLMSALLLLTASAAWWPVYEAAPFVVLAVVTVLAGTGFAVLAAARRWSGPVVLVGTVLLWLVLGVPLAVPAKALWGVVPTPEGLLDLIVTTASGWRQLLTIELPVGDYQALLVPVFVLLLVCSVVGTTVAARGGRWAALMVVFPTAVLVAGIVFGGSVALAPVVVGALFAVEVVVWLALTAPVPPLARRQRDGRAGGLGERSARGRSWIVMAAVVAAAVAVAGGIALVVPPGDRVVARDAVDQPFDPNDQPSPLSAFRADLKPPADQTVMLTVSGAKPGDRIVTARMDRYDGVVFDVGGGGGSGAGGSGSGSGRGSGGGALFTRVPERFDGGDPVPGAELPVGPDRTLEIEVGGYRGVWVPTVGSPVSVTFDGPDASALQDALYIGRAVATVADPVGLADGDRYRLVTRDPAPVPAAGLTALTPGPLAVTPGTGVPDAVALRASEWAPASGSPGERLAGILDGLHGGYVSSGLTGEVFSRSGHGADRLQEFLTSTPMVGDAEQYAAAAALLAETVGFPARVATGFDIPVTDVAGSAGTAGTAGAAGSGGSAGAPAAIPVTGSDATAWIEVYTAEAGWVAVDPNPEPRPIPDSATDDSTTAVQPPEVVPPASDQLEGPADSAPAQQDDDRPAAPDAVLALVLRILAVAGITLGVLAVLAAPFLTVIALKLRRRARRRTRGSARSRAAGGWAEVVDSARDGAIPTPVHATRREAARSLGAPEALALAEWVDSALYSPAPPTEAELIAIWQASDRERKRLLGDRGLLARLRARVSTRSLRTYHGTDRTSTVRKRRKIQ
ncbi:transglutaminaseTgpA domain-containing protein [Herbiconiux solani]|uniref:transglutaminaseTgpA domain-containing protein n=1 Tax=Herbiconiux solani TaxID=661329 RepID=UPI000825DB67|nr:transglutaminaseTgpA domain-containing protein [Herbiconiux solani]